jgi:predicted metalloendopeptidase
LNARNAQAISYFEDNFTVFGVYHVDGEQTLGENYADLGSLECITSLAHSSAQLEKLFESYATLWGGRELDTAVIDQIATDEHSPSVIRVNAILSTVDAFYETYDVQEGDGMYIAPENRISRWY